MHGILRIIEHFLFFKQLNPFIFNEYMADYPLILSPQMLPLQTHAQHYVHFATLYMSCKYLCKCDICDHDNVP